MTHRWYQLHDLTVRLTAQGGPMPGVGWIFQKLDAFRVDSAECVDIDIHVGPFGLDTTGWFNIDHRYYARPNELFFVSSWNGVRYRTHWHGLEATHEGPVTVKLDIGAMGLVRFPWLMQADWIAHMFVIKPILELLWARRDRFVVHAAAAAKNGQAAVFTGYGSSLKTSFTMALIRRGWDLLGDDQVLLTQQGLLPMAVGLRTFDFRVHHLPTEYLTPTRTIRLGLHLLKNREPRVRVAGLTPIGSMNVLLRTDRSQASWQHIEPVEAARRIMSNCRAETIQSVRSSPPISRPLVAYKLVFPEFDHDAYWDPFQAMLARQLTGKPVRRIALTKVWHDRLMDAAALPHEADDA